MEGPLGTTVMGSHRARKVLRASLLLPQAAALESLPSLDYLERTGVKTFLEDALKQLLVERPESAVRFFDKYFSRVLAMTHVEGRSFEFVDANLRNRLAFLALLDNALGNIDEAYEMTMDDFHQLAATHCAGLPRSLVVQACSHLVEEESCTAEIPFKRILTCFRACLIYNEFLAHVYHIYAEYMRPEKKDACETVDEKRRKDGAQAKLSEAVATKVRDEHRGCHEKFTCPPLSVVEACLYTSGTFKQFCGTFVEHVAIDAAINELHSAHEKVGEAMFRLPTGDAADGPDMDALKQPRKSIKRRSSSKAAKRG
ncbi:hypothetical protein SPRG_07135 [Saprolegnia parasitica CBS 223.65]|uniref:Centriolar satellite-associated tubulin polyglutamylase complex regulator 1 n=1 Tax=Saprolegnia parasitica (strain CBS 223.65) TaxID=695850 RepID=A0A067CM11_SAPPC|nr:hypothetical protein SPRG_07135 [Saprolegnia parasitica CBS 223.65]KDO27862.1 hypothetical protein SPRG_07135 [Saprolegnia parasitica CBS 223.65]|eukprot:XP_012201322.1 hypothetical protein SPRG_07135 [Saprolegnia parasitica CBS 223.65]